MSYAEKRYAAAAPVAGGMRPGARRCIAHTVLQRQGQGNTALVEICLAAATRQSRLEGGKLLRQVWAGWSR